MYSWHRNRPPKGVFKDQTNMGFVKHNLKKFFSYFKEVLEEARKVTWPNQKTTTRYSVLVIVVCVAVGGFFAILDAVFNLGLGSLLKIAS